MKTNHLLSLPIAIGGTAGFALRLTQNRTGFESSTGLPIPGNTAGIALVVLLAAMAVILLLLSRRLPENTEQPPVFPGSFSTEDTSLLMLPVAGIFLMALSGLLDILLGTGSLSRTVLELPGIGTLVLFVGDMFSPTVHLLLGVFSLAAAVALMLAILNCRRKGKREARMDGSYLLVPVIALTMRLVLTYRMDSMNPSLTAYYVELLALVFLILGFFRLSSFAFRMGRIRPFALYCGMAVICTLTVLADLNTLLSSTLLYLGGTSTLMGCLFLLMTNANNN